MKFEKENKRRQVLKKFYNSRQWQRARLLKIQTAYGICERCGKAGWEVHHIEPLTLINMHDPNISINQDNLELLCTSCHSAINEWGHKPTRKDIKFDKEGNVIPRKHIKKA